MSRPRLRQFMARALACRPLDPMAASALELVRRRVPVFVDASMPLAQMDLSYRGILQCCIRPPWRTAAIYVDLSERISRDHNDVLVFVYEQRLDLDLFEPEAKIPVAASGADRIVTMMAIAEPGPTGAMGFLVGPGYRPIPASLSDPGVRDVFGWGMSADDGIGVMAIYKSFLPPDEEEDGARHALAAAATACYALDLLHARNVAVRPRAAVGKKNKLKRSGRSFDWHDLVVCRGAAPDRKIIRPGSGERLITRAHIRRGHFKTYTEERPLFGKWSGRFWWTDHVAGDEEEGFVHKDYVIGSAKGERQ